MADHIYTDDRARAAKASEIIDTLDDAGFDCSMRSVALADLAGKAIWITVNNKPGRKGFEVGKVQIAADGAVTAHGQERAKIAAILGIEVAK